MPHTSYGHPGEPQIGVLYQQKSTRWAPVVAAWCQNVVTETITPSQLHTPREAYPVRCCHGLTVNEPRGQAFTLPQITPGTGELCEVTGSKAELPRPSDENNSDTHSGHPRVQDKSRFQSPDSDVSTIAGVQQEITPGTGKLCEVTTSKAELPRPADETHSKQSRVHDKSRFQSRDSDVSTIPRAQQGAVWGARCAAIHNMPDPTGQMLEWAPGADAANDVAIAQLERTLVVGQYQKAIEHYEMQGSIVEDKISVEEATLEELSSAHDRSEIKSQGEDPGEVPCPAVPEHPTENNQHEAGNNPVSQSAAGSNPISQSAVGNDSVIQSTAAINSASQSAAGNTSVTQSAVGNDSVIQSAVGNDSIIQPTAGINSVSQSAAENNSVRQSAAENNSVSQSAAGNNPVSQSAAGSNPISQSAVGNDSVIQSTAAINSASQSAAENTSVTQSAVGNDSVIQSAVGNDSIIQPTAGINSVSQSAAGNNSVRQSAAENNSVSQSTAGINSVSQSAAGNNSSSQSAAENNSVGQSAAENNSVSQSTAENNSVSQSVVGNDSKDTSASQPAAENSSTVSELLSAGGSAEELKKGNVSSPDAKMPNAPIQYRARLVESDERFTIFHLKMYGFHVDLKVNRDRKVINANFIKESSDAKRTISHSTSNLGASSSPEKDDKIRALWKHRDAILKEMRLIVRERKRKVKCKTWQVPLPETTVHRSYSSTARREARDSWKQKKYPLAGNRNGLARVNLKKSEQLSSARKGVVGAGSPVIALSRPCEVNGKKTVTDQSSSNDSPALYPDANTCVNFGESDGLFSSKTTAEENELSDAPSTKRLVVKGKEVAAGCGPAGERGGAHTAGGEEGLTGVSSQIGMPETLEAACHEHGREGLDQVQEPARKRPRKSVPRKVLKSTAGWNCGKPDEEKVHSFEAYVSGRQHDNNETKEAANTGREGFLLCFHLSAFS